MDKTPRTDDLFKSYEADRGGMAHIVLRRGVEQLETELADKDRQLAEALKMLSDLKFLQEGTVLANAALKSQLAQALAEIERLHAQCDVIKDIERHRVHEWYHGKLSALHEWAKKQPEEISKPIFSCLANGAPSVYESPEYSKKLNSLKYALEKSEKEVLRLKDALAAERGER